MVVSSGGVIKASCCDCKPYRCPDCSQVWSPGLVICRCLPAQVERYVASVCFCTLEHLRAECRPFGASEEKMLDCLPRLSACAEICQSGVNAVQIAVQSCHAGPELSQYVRFSPWESIIQLLRMFAWQRYVNFLRMYSDLFG